MINDSNGRPSKVRSEAAKRSSLVNFSSRN